MHGTTKKITGILREYLRIFTAISCSALLRMRCVSDKDFNENQDTFYD